MYKIIFPECGKSYVGKTDRNIRTRLDKHGSRKDQPMNVHFSNCLLFRETIELFAVPSANDEVNVSLDLKEHFVNSCLNNYKILDYNSSWLQLCFLEAFSIKQLSSKINKGIGTAIISMIAYALHFYAFVCFYSNVFYLYLIKYCSVLYPHLISS